MHFQNRNANMIYIFISGVNIDFIILQDGVDCDKMVYNGTEWCRTLGQIGAGWCRIVQIAAG